MVYYESVSEKGKKYYTHGFKTVCISAYCEGVSIFATLTMMKLVFIQHFDINIYYNIY